MTILACAALGACARPASVPPSLAVVPASYYHYRLAPSYKTWRDAPAPQQRPTTPALVRRLEMIEYELRYMRGEILPKEPASDLP